MLRLTYPKYMSPAVICTKVSTHAVQEPCQLEKSLYICRSTCIMTGEILSGTTKLSLRCRYAVVRRPHGAHGKQLNECLVHACTCIYMYVQLHIIFLRSRLSIIIVKSVVQIIFKYNVTKGLAGSLDVPGNLLTASSSPVHLYWLSKERKNADKTRQDCSDEFNHEKVGETYPWQIRYILWFAAKLRHQHGIHIYVVEHERPLILQ